MTLFKINDTKIKVSVLYLLLCLLWLFSGKIYTFFTMSFVVLLHELFHAFIARLFGFYVEQIILYPFGGMAEIKGINNDYVFEGIVAAAGPFISLFTGFLWQLGDKIGVLCSWDEFVDFSYNVALINLLPIYPLDGGRIFSCLFKGVWGEKSGRRISLVFSITVSSLFLLKSLFDVIFYKNYAYIIMAVFMFVSSFTAIKNPRKFLFREVFWKSENVKFLKAYGDEKVINILENLCGNCFYCILAVDRNQNFLGVFTEKQLFDGLLDSAEIKLEDFCNRPFFSGYL